MSADEIDECRDLREEAQYVDLLRDLFTVFVLFFELQDFFSSIFAQKPKSYPNIYTSLRTLIPNSTAETRQIRNGERRLKKDDRTSGDDNDFRLVQ